MLRELPSLTIQEALWQSLWHQPELVLKATSQLHTPHLKSDVFSQTHSQVSLSRVSDFQIPNLILVQQLSNTVTAQTGCLQEEIPLQSKGKKSGGWLLLHLLSIWSPGHTGPWTLCYAKPLAWDTHRSICSLHFQLANPATFTECNPQHLTT